MERETRFKSALVLDRVIVTDALSCVKMCSSVADCASANFLAFDVELFYCELNKDTPHFYSLYELKDRLELNHFSALLYGISCERLNQPSRSGLFGRR